MERPSELLKGKLDRDIYLMMMLNMPVPTVDFIVRKYFADGSRKFLLIKRNEGAYADEWFVAGGRQFRGESQFQALYRIAKEEIGLAKEQIVNCVFSHCQDTFNPGGDTAGGVLPDWHSIWHFYVIDVVPDFEPVLDSTSRDFQWFDNSETNFCKPVTEALTRGLFFKKN